MPPLVRAAVALMITAFALCSFSVWAIWLIPFVTGLILGRRRGH